CRCGLRRCPLGRRSSVSNLQSQEEHYERSKPTLSATNVGKCRSRSRRPPGRPHDRRQGLFDGRAEAQRRRTGKGKRKLPPPPPETACGGRTFPELVELPYVAFISSTDRRL